MVFPVEASDGLVPIASLAFQARLASVSALVLQVYDWCTSSKHTPPRITEVLYASKKVLCLDKEV